MYNYRYSLILRSVDGLIGLLRLANDPKSGYWIPQLPQLTREGDSSTTALALFQQMQGSHFAREWVDKGTTIHRTPVVARGTCADMPIVAPPDISEIMVARVKDKDEMKVADGLVVEWFDPVKVRDLNLRDMATISVMDYLIAEGIDVYGPAEEGTQ